MKNVREKALDAMLVSGAVILGIRAFRTACTLIVDLGKGFKTGLKNAIKKDIKEYIETSNNVALNKMKIEQADLYYDCLREIEEEELEKEERRNKIKQRREELDNKTENKTKIGFC